MGKPLRKNLKIFRVQHNLTQAQMAEKIGCTRATYSNIEKNKRNGRDAFWNDLQRAFNIEDSEMWALRKVE